MLIKRKAYRNKIEFIRVSFNRSDGTVCKIFKCRHKHVDWTDPVCKVCDTVLEKATNQQTYHHCLTYTPSDAYKTCSNI